MTRDEDKGSANRVNKKKQMVQMVSHILGLMEIERRNRCCFVYINGREKHGKYKKKIVFEKPN